MLEYFEKNGLTPHPEQVRVLKTIHSNWGKYDNFVVEAPPGVGKSHIALAIADYVNTAYIVTSSIQLQDQYINTNDKLAIMKGKSNYICELYPIFDVSTSICNFDKQIISNCINNSGCPYYNAVFKALDSKTILTNYAYLIYAINYGLLKNEEFSAYGSKICRDVIIMDEAHKLENNVINVANIKFFLNELEKYNIDISEYELTGDSSTDIDVVLSISNVIKNEIKKLKSEIEYFNSNTNVILSPKETKHLEAVKLKYKSLNNLLAPITLFEDTHDSVEWIFNSSVENNSAELIPLSAGNLSSIMLNTISKKFVYLSATIGDFNTFCQENGLDQRRTIFIKEDSPFPPEQSPIISIPKAKLGYKYIDKSLPTIVSCVNDILALHSDCKGIIHTPSYKVNNFIVNSNNNKETVSRLLHRDLYTDSSTKLSNADLIELHKLSTNNSVLLSPSMGEGIDLYDDLARFQIIIKLPWGSLADFRTSIKVGLTPNWYTNNMWLNILQASGRGTRHIQDYCVTYILDESFPYYYEQWKDNLPTWFKNRLHFY